MQSAGAARDASGQDASHGANPNPNFELAMAVLFQAPSTEQTQADGAHLGGLGTQVGLGQRGGATKETKDKEASTKPAPDAERQATQGMDPRLASQQQVLEAQQRLMRTADVADRAAAELRGEGDQGDQGASGEHAELAPASAPSAPNKDASTRSATEPAPTQPRNPAAGHENAAAAQDSGAKHGSMVNRAEGTSSHATTPTQQSSGGSQQGGGESRQQANNGATLNATNRGAASAQAKLGVPDPSGASASNAARTTSTTATSPSSNTSSIAGPGSLATVRDPLRAFTARPEPKAARQADPSNLPNQVARGLAAAVRQRDGTLTLRLSPESLGDIKIVVRVESGQVSAQIDAQTDQARQLLSDTASTLRSALEAQGLVVERIEVAPAERHATMDPAAGPHAPIAENRAQGGALSAPDQPPPHGFGDGAPPEHRDASGHESGSGSQGASTDAHFDAAEASADPTPLGTIDFAQVDGRWVLRVDLVA
jgi:flagellar hook-length control protein FliK